MHEKGKLISWEDGSYYQIGRLFIILSIQMGLLQQKYNFMEEFKVDECFVKKLFKEKCLVDPLILSPKLSWISRKKEKSEHE